MKIANIKATTLRTALTVVISVIIGISVIGFYFAQSWITDYAIKVDQTASRPVTDSNDPKALAQIRDEITKNQLYGDKASAMITSSQNFKDQIIKDVNKYASISGVSVVDYNLATPDTSGADTTVAIEGIKSNFATITLKNPIPIQNLLHFLKLIESNLPIMQLTGISLTPSANSTDNVTIDPITIEVYTR